MDKQEEAVRFEKASQDYFKHVDEEVNAFADLSFTVDKGDSLALLSPKRVTLFEIVKCLSLLSNLSSGKYFLLGKDCTSLSREEQTKVRLASVGIIVYRKGLLDHHSVYDNVAIRLTFSEKYKSQEEKNQRIESCLHIAGLDDLKDASVSDLSIFEQRRTALAAALANSPSVLVADNPTFGLKSEEKKQFMDLLLSLCSDGTTVIVVTSVREEAERCKKALDI
jgi:putative ABC transport system ATP-binding protein